MNFKSKTALIEHIKELVKDGYLIEEWNIIESLKTKTKAQKIYKINFEAIK